MINRYSTVTFLLIIALCLSTSFSQDYLWPTSASTYMSSSFCEFRDGHYHSAIDIKTWLREGYPVYAVEDGFIERIRVSPFGYGKVLYLRLKDGNIAVYAHLQRFTKMIDKKIREKQLHNQQYRIDWNPKNMNVKKGDIVAYTGRTGIGLPHLHFEIRNKKNNPINPQAFYPQIKDEIRPRLQKIALVPMSRGATINGEYLPQIFSLTYIKDGIYIIKNPLKTNGNIGIAIMGYDQADDVSNKYGFYQTIMEVEGEEIFHITYDRLHFSTTSHIYTETYYPFWVDLEEVFHKLYIEPFNPLHHYKRYAHTDGTIHVHNKPVDFSIIVRDFKGNESQIRGELVPDDSKQISLKSVSRVKNTAYVKFNSEPIKDIKFYTGNNKQAFLPVNYFEIIDGEVGNPMQSIVAKIDLQDSSHNFLKIAIKSFENQFSQRVVSLSDISYINDFHTKLHYIGDNLVFEVTDYYYDGEIRILPTLTEFKLSPLPDGRGQTVIPGDMLTAPKTQCQYYSNNQLKWSKDLDVARIIPNMWTKPSWFDSTFSIGIVEGAFLDTVLLTSNRLPSDSLRKILPLASNIFEIQPSNIPLFKKITVQIVPDSLPTWGKWSLFSTDGYKSVSFLPTTFNTDSSALQAKTRRLGKFVIASDTIPPYLEILSPKAGLSYKQNPEIVIDLYDEHSGIDNEENISLLLDGKFVLPEWDPEDKSVIAYLDYTLPKGNHILTVSINDRCGNIKRRAVYFSIL